MKNKVVFWLNADFTIFAVAREIQKKYDADLYAIIDITDKPKDFFINQKLIEFKKIWFYHDHIKPSKNPDLEFLSSFEQKYKINLWQLAYNDRFFYNYNEFYNFSDQEVLSIIEQECRLFENIIDEIKPNFLIMFMTMSHHDHLFYELCKQRSITPLILNDTRLGRRWCVTSIPNNVDFIPVNFTGKTNISNFEQINKIREQYDVFKTILNYESNFLKSKTKMIVAAIKFLFLQNNTNTKSHYTYFGRTKLKVLLTHLKYVIIEPIRLNFIKKNFLDKIQDEKTILFGLPASPERTILLAAPFYTNHLEIIESIVKSLPIGYKLYVKEHPAMNSRGWRKISFYKKLMKLPNVKLVHPNTKSIDLIKNSSLVIVITGTLGFEAACQNKPSIVFGDTDYSMLSCVTRVNSLENLPFVIRNSLTKNVNPIEIGEYIEIVSANSAETDLLSFRNLFATRFYHKSFLVDVSIDELDVKSFLDEYHNMIEPIANEFLKKIQ